MADFILVAEDDITQCWLLETHLKELGYTVCTARDGREAAQKAQEKRFKLILMDLQMPTMDGYEATKSIRDFESRNALNSVPIIAMAEETELTNPFIVGMSGCLRKPIARPELQTVLNQNDCRSVIQTQLELRGRAATVEKDQAPKTQSNGLCNSLIRVRKHRHG